MSKLPTKLRPTLNAIDLFCGAGGLSLGAARAGLRVVAGVELDEEAIATHAANFPQSRHLQFDISSLEGETLLKEAGLNEGELTALIGGPPCQGFSVIGSRDPMDERNELFGHFMRLVAETNPIFFVAENVPGIAQAQNSAVLKKALEKVPKHYRLLPPLVVEGQRFGAPTSRKRIFFIGVDGSRMVLPSSKDFEPSEQTQVVTVRDAMRGLPRKVSAPSGGQPEIVWRKVAQLPKSQFFERVQGYIPPGVGNPEALRRYHSKREVNGHIGVVHGRQIEERYDALAPGEKDQVSRSVRLVLNGHCPTLRSGTGSDKGRFQAVRPIHPTQARVITPREAARLQGFPDWFLLPNTKWHSFRQIGNSVSPLVAEAVLAELVRYARMPIQATRQAA